jgi:hypothetical protein
MGVQPVAATEIAHRLAILDLMARYNRALDRMDLELAHSCWWPDGTDDHAPLYVGPIGGFFDWVWPVHEKMVLTRHVVTNTVFSPQNETTMATESYWTATMRLPVEDAITDLQSGGRYIDRFDLRDGEWRFGHRQSIREWGRTDPAGATAGSPIAKLITPNNPDAPLTPAMRDRSDYSYSALGNLPGASV